MLGFTNFTAARFFAKRYTMNSSQEIPPVLPAFAKI